MIHLNKLKNIISENNNLKITFVGAFNQGGSAALYTYNGSIHTTARQYQSLMAIVSNVIQKISKTNFNRIKDLNNEIS